MDTLDGLHSTSPLSHRRRMIRLLSVSLIALALCGVFLASWNSTTARGVATTLHYPGCGPTIQACINAAAPGDTIFVASGSYTESFTLNKPVSLTGASAATTILNAMVNERVLTVTGSIINNSVVISGLTFANGHAIVANWPNDCYSETTIWSGRGGGIQVQGSSSPVLQNVIITGNQASCDGGGLAASGSITLVDVIVSNNQTAQGFSHGGGAYISDTATVLRSTFIGNLSSADGGGLYAGQMILTDCQFVGNSTHGAAGFWDGYGGGAYALNSSTITGGYFERNHCVRGPFNNFCLGGAFGGVSTSISGTRFLSNTDIAVYASAYPSVPMTVINVLFQGNDAGALYVVNGSLFVTNTQFINNNLAGLFSPMGALTYTPYTYMPYEEFDLSIVNSLFTKNISGSAISASGNSVGILHTTIVGSGSGDTAVVLTGLPGSVFHKTITNTIIASYTIGISQTASQVSEDYNLFYGNGTNLAGTIASGGHSVEGNPAFCAPSADNYHLCAGSAALDAGINADVVDDIDGNPRPYGAGFDIGYDEYWPLVAVDDVYRTVRDETLSIDAANGVLANDTSNHMPLLTVITWTLPTTGTLALMPDGAFVYTPPLSFTGKITFTYQVADGITTSQPALVTLWVFEPPFYLPLIAQSYQAAEGTPLTFDPSNDTQPALSPDGQMVIFLSDRTGQADIFSASTTGSPATNLTHTPLAQEDTPVYSPDGSKIAFASDRSGDWDIYLMDADGTNVQRTIGYTGTDELQPAFTPDGNSLLFSSNLTGGNWDVYSATLGSEAPFWARLTTDPALDRFPAISANGMTIAFRSERDGNSEIYVMDADGSHQRRVLADPALDWYPAITPDGSGIVFTSWRSGTPQVYSVNLGGTGLITWTTRAGWEADYPRLASDGRYLVYAARSITGTFDVFMRPYATPLYKAAERGALNMSGKCDWEAGTLAYGLAQAWRATGDDHYLMWLQNWINACIPVKTTIDHVNDGLLGYAALIAYETQGRPEQLAYAQKVANYFVYTATRTSDGTLTHWEDTVWADTLLGTVPFMAEMSKVSGNNAYLEEAITQTLQHAAHLEDSVTGLYHHAWDESQNTYWSPSYWARGNGWAMLADVELLSSLPVTHPQRALVLNLLQKQAAGLKPLQAADGRWHTVVNRPDFYLESSGSALIGYAVRRAVQAGWVNAGDYDPVARLALLGVWRKVLSDDVLSEVSAPTGPMLTEIEYNAVPNNSLQLYGQGALLLLASPLEP